MLSALFPNLSRLVRLTGRALAALGLAISAADAAVDITVDPAKGRAPISPFIYGTNQDLPGVVAQARRQGGNRMTGYNWENNASNAGSDYLQQSDDYMTSALGIPSSQANVPAITLTHFQDQSIAAGTPYTVLTLQMAGFVAADKNGPVSSAEAAPSSRWVSVVNQKPTAFTTTPSLTDGIVYMDELLNLLVQRYGNATSPTGIKGYDLDNEPDLWSSTHPRLHPAQPACVDFIDRSVDLAKAIKRIDPAADTLGFVSYGFNGYYSFQNAQDWNTEKAKGPYNWFVDYYLDRMAKASTTAGMRLLDVLDLHNYSEATGGGSRVTDSTDYTNVACNQARIQAPRSFWDTTYVENSWIGQYYSSFLPFLPKIQSSISTFYPGTKLAFSEYNFGGEGHISGGLAEADILGIFGKNGVYLASIWPLHSDLSYVISAFKLYLNYDGAGGRFGDTTVSATTSDATNCSAYASVNNDSGSALHVVVLNKNYTAATPVTIHIAGSTPYTSARIFAFDGTSAAITERAAVTSISGNQFSYTLPPLTAAHIVLAVGTVAAPRVLIQPASATVNTGAKVVFSVLANDSSPLNYQWRKGGANIAGATTASLSLASVAAGDSGTYDVVITNASSVSTTTNSATLSVNAAPYVPPASALVNISSRAQIGTGTDAMVAGFVVGGAGAKKMLIRAVGPSLATVGLSSADVLATPSLQVTTPSGTLLAANVGWADDPAVSAAARSVGAFPFLAGSADAALIVSVPPGNYTAIVSPGGGASGIGLIELYDLDQNAASRLINISTRARVGTGLQSLVAGFFVGGTTTRNVLVRAVGPTLTALDPANFGTGVVLPDPRFDLETPAGVLISSNDDWGGNGSAVAAAAQAVGAFPLAAGSKDAALVATLNPGSYTPVVSDRTNAPGLALVEVYEAP